MSHHKGPSVVMALAAIVIALQPSTSQAQKKGDVWSSIFQPLTKLPIFKSLHQKPSVGKNHFPFDHNGVHYDVLVWGIPEDEFGSQPMVQIYIMPIGGALKEKRMVLDEQIDGTVDGGELDQKVYNQMLKEIEQYLHEARKKRPSGRSSSAGRLFL